MIVILFTTGGFGSTIEYIVRQFSKEFESTDTAISTDGSMHGFKKEYHPVSSSELRQLKNHPHKITSVIYPNCDQSASDVLSLFKSVTDHHDQIIFISCPTVKDYTLATLCAIGKTPILNNTEILVDSHAHKWNSDYTSVADMKLWERRELISLTLLGNMNQIVSCTDGQPPSWFKTSVCNITADLYRLSLKILEYLKLTSIDHVALQEFVQQWILAQQPYIKQAELIDLIVETIISKQEFAWSTLSFAEEALIQCRLLHAGYEIQCDGLDEFPTDTHTFRKIIFTKVH